MKRLVYCFATIVITFVFIGAAQATDPGVKCESGKLKIASKYSACRLNADSKAVKKGATADYAKCESKFSDKWDKTEAKAGPGVCPSEGDKTDVQNFLDASGDSVTGALEGGDLPLDVASCNAALRCPLRGITGPWRITTSGDGVLADTCILTLSHDGLTVDGEFFACSSLPPASLSGSTSGAVLTQVEDAAAVCGGDRFEGDLTFEPDCESASGDFTCRSGIGGPVTLTGFLAAVRPVAVERIDGVVASSPDMGTCCSGGFPAMVDGSGLASLSTTALHDCNDTTMWKSNTPITTGELDFDLGAVFALNQIAVWNSAQVSGERGVKDVTIETSVDGVTFAALPGAPTQFAKQTSCPSPAEIFEFNPVAARYVRFNITSSWTTGLASNTGIAEIFFGYLE
jgi:hypothetical protein